MATSAANQPQLFADHLQELRSRLLACVAVLLTVGGASYFYRNQVVELIARPLDQHLIYTAPSGAFQFIMLVCLGVGVLATLPVGLYNLVRFLEPALNHGLRTRGGPLKIIAASSFLAACGFTFCYMLVIPSALKFFASFNLGPIQPLIAADQYLSFTVGCLITFALIFQLPLLFLLFNNFNKFPPGTLPRYRRHVLIGSLAIALFLPFTYDPLTQFVVALPIIVLYEVSILCVWLANRSSSQPISEVDLGNDLTQQVRVTPSVRTTTRIHTAPPAAPARWEGPIDRSRPIQLG